MSLRIAFDLDGVLADMDAALLRQAEILFGEALTRKRQDRAAADADADQAPTEAATTPPLTSLNISARQQQRLWQHVETIENFWETLSEIEPGAIERLSAEAAARRWEIIFVTRRPATAGFTAQVQSQRWLESRGFQLPSVYVVQGSRGRIAAALALDIVVDDRPENCADVVADSKARAVLVWREDDQLLPPVAQRPGVAMVKTVRECLDVLAQLHPPAKHEPGTLDRVKRLLGLKESASA